MKLLPKWYLTKTLPAFNDGESATALEQTHRLYNSMNELITEYNKFVDDTNTKLENFVSKYNEDIELFTTSFRQEFQDFIDTVDLKIADLEARLSEFGKVALEPIQAELTRLSNELNTLKQELENLNIEEQFNLINGEISSIKQQLAELDIEYVGKTGTVNGYISVEFVEDEAGLPIYYPVFKNYEMEEPVRLATQDDVTSAINEAITSALNSDY